MRILSEHAMHIDADGETLSEGALHTAAEDDGGTIPSFQPRSIVGGARLALVLGIAGHPEVLKAGADGKERPDRTRGWREVKQRTDKHLAVARTETHDVVRRVGDGLESRVVHGVERPGFFNADVS